MMPSACTKQDQKASSEAFDPITKAVNVVEKKVRNLEKRKGKLDGYREKLDSGEGLNEDQREAIGKYDGVVQNLEFARDLQKQFLSIVSEGEKLNRRQQKKEKLEKQSQEVARMKVLLQLQGLLDGMGADTVRTDFLSGSNGAVVLTEDNLDQLDELYKLISPTRDGETSYMDQLATASEHLVCFLDMKDKEVIGTTYKNLHEMVCQIHECGYFDRVAAETVTEEAPAAEEEPAEVVQDEVQQPEIEFGGADIVSPALETVTAEMSSLSAQLSQQQQQQQQQQQSQEIQTPAAPEPTNVALTHSQEEEAASAAQPPFEDQESFFSATAPFSRQRPVQEILSSVQGTYDFLQESHVDVDSPAHVDPAVVAAHPMAPSLSQQVTESGLTAHGYQTAAGLLVSETQSSQYQTSPQYQTSQYQSVTSHATQPSAVEQTLQQGEHPSSTQSDTQYAAAAAAAAAQRDLQTSSFVVQQSALEAATFTTDNYNQNIMAQSLPSSTAQHSYTDQISTRGMDASLGLVDSSSGPQPIPLPSQVLAHQTYSSAADNSAAYDTAGYNSATDSSQSYVTATDNSQSNSDSSEEKKPFLNPNADMFRPAGYNQQQELQQDPAYSQGGGTSSSSNEPNSYNQAAAGSASFSEYQSANYSGFEDSAGFHSAGYAGNTRGSSATRTGSGSREGSGGNRPSGGSRPSNANSGMINNGYPRTNRSGAPYSNAGNRGGYSNGSRGGSGGGANRNTFQGYPARQDYRPEGGYQGYGNNNFGSAGGYNKNTRSGSGGGGAPRAGTRGGTAPGMRSGGGAGRGGQMRGSSQGGGGGGGYNRGGYAPRPGSAGSSMPQTST